MAVDRPDLQQPDANEPVINQDGLMNPSWYEYFQQLNQFVNELKTEVNTQNP